MKKLIILFFITCLIMILRCGLINPDIYLHNKTQKGVAKLEIHEAHGSKRWVFEANPGERVHCGSFAKKDYETITYLPPDSIKDWRTFHLYKSLTSEISFEDNEYIVNFVF